MGGLGAVEIILILVVIVLLFGARKLPDLARSVGRSMRIFKSEVTEMTNESKAREESQPQAELTKGDENDQFWQSPDMQPRQNPQAQQTQGQPQQQNWNQQQGNPQVGNQQQNWVDPQQGMQQPPQQNWSQQPGQQPYPGQQPQKGNNYPQQPQQ